MFKLSFREVFSFGLCCLPSLGFLLLATPPTNAQPANDNFVNAEVLSGTSGSAVGTTIGATKELGEPNHAGNAGGNSVWYVWEAPVSGAAEFELFDSDFDTTIGAYQGNSVNTLTPRAANDETIDYLVIFSKFIANISQSRIRFPIQAGGIYYIAVDGYNDPNFGTDSGNLVLSWHVAPRPANDSFSQAQTLTGATGVLLAENAGATKEPGEPNHAGNIGGASIWYSWRPPSSGTALIQTQTSLDPSGALMDTLLGIYTGSGVGSLTQIAANDNFGTRLDSRATFSASAGTTYWIAVDGKNYVTNVVHGKILLSWTLTVPASNNSFANAQVLTGSCGFTQGSNIGATKESGEPNHAANAGGASVWFSWTAPSDGPAVLTTAGSPYLDSMLAVYTGASLATLTPVVSNDDITPAFVDDQFLHLTYSRVEFTATAGTTYRIALDGWDNPAVAGQTPSTGIYFLNWALGAPPNDEFFSAETITGLSGTVRACTLLASKDFDEPNHVGNVGGRSIWYQWTAPTSGVANIDLAGSTFDTLLAVYTGDSVDALTLVAENDNADINVPESRVHFMVEAGITYNIAIDGLGIPARNFYFDGWVVMNYKLTPPPTLQITPSGGGFNINWAGPYRLESTLALVPGGGTVWTPVSGTAPVTVSNSGGQMFFRAVFP